MKTVNQTNLLGATDKVLTYLGRDKATFEQYSFNIEALKAKIEQAKTDHLNSPAYPTASTIMRTMRKERKDAYIALVQELEQAAVRFVINAGPDSLLKKVFNPTIVAKQNMQTMVNFVERVFLPIQQSDLESLGVKSELRDKIISASNRYAELNKQVADNKREAKSTTIGRTDTTTELRKLISQASATGKRVFCQINKAYYNDYKMSKLIMN